MFALQVNIVGIASTSPPQGLMTSQNLNQWQATVISPYCSIGAYQSGLRTQRLFVGFKSTSQYSKTNAVYE